MWNTVYATYLNDGIEINGGYSSGGNPLYPYNSGSTDLGKSDYLWNTVYATYLSDGIEINGGYSSNDNPLRPYNDGTTDLGSSSYSWSKVYANTLKDGIYIDGSYGVSSSDHFVPYSDKNQNLGSDSYRWKDTYTGTLDASGDVKVNTQGDGGQYLILNMDDAAGTDCTFAEFAIGGTVDTDANWRMGVVASNLVIQVRVSGAWTNATTFTRP